MPWCTSVMHQMAATSTAETPVLPLLSHNGRNASELACRLLRGGQGGLVRRRGRDWRKGWQLGALGHRRRLLLLLRRRRHRCRAVLRPATVHAATCGPTAQERNQGRQLNLRYQLMACGLSAPRTDAGTQSEATCRSRRHKPARVCSIALRSGAAHHSRLQRARTAAAARRSRRQQARMAASSRRTPRWRMWASLPPAWPARRQTAACNGCSCCSSRLESVDEHVQVGEAAISASNLSTSRVHSPKHSTAQHGLIAMHTWKLSKLGCCCWGCCGCA